MTRLIICFVFIFSMSACGIVGNNKFHVKVEETTFRVPGNRIVNVLRGGFVFNGSDGVCKKEYYSVDGEEVPKNLYVDSESKISNIEYKKLDDNFNQYNMMCIGDSKLQTCAVSAIVDNVRLSSSFKKDSLELSLDCFVDAKKDLLLWKYK